MRAQEPAAHNQTRAPKQARRSVEGKTGLFSSAEVLLVKKDMGAIWAQKSQRSLLMALPLILAAVIPAVYFVAISLLPVAMGAKLPQALLAILPKYVNGLDYRQSWLVAFTDLLCPLLFLCVPILTAAASASYAFVTERESGTLESLLLTSVDAKAVFNAKVTSCTVLSALISGVAFVIFSITAVVADVFAGVPLFFSLDWLVMAFLMAPALSLFSVVFVGLIVTRVHSTGESLQTMGYLILPVAAIYLAQFTGIFRVNLLALLIISLILAILDVVLFNAAARGFAPEKLLEDEPNE